MTDAVSEPKQLIFYTALDLFAASTYEEVSLGDIGKAINKTKASIYNHFESKQAILDDIYSYFCEHFFDEKLSLEQIKPILLQNSLTEILHAICFEFPPEIQIVMTKIMRILHTRKYHDKKAQEIVSEYFYDKSIAYGEEVFSFMIGLGRTKHFDAHTTSVCLNYTRQSTYSRWIINPVSEFYEMLLTEEKRIFEALTERMHDLGPLA